MRLACPIRKIGLINYSWNLRHGTNRLCWRRLGLPLTAQFSSTIPEPDFGDYHILLPDEPYVFGTSHITPRIVPERIVRPPYASQSSRSLTGNTSDTEYIYDGDGRISLGTDEELRIRTAAKLAKKVREYAGTLAKVNECAALIPGM